MSLGAHGIFFPGGALFFVKKVDDFLVVALKTQILTVCNCMLMHKTLYNISRGQVPPPFPLLMAAGAHGHVQWWIKRCLG